jgi:hypothetical protein
MQSNVLQTALLQSERIQEFPLNRRRSLFQSRTHAPDFFAKEIGDPKANKFLLQNMKQSKTEAPDLSSTIEEICELCFQLTFYLHHIIRNPWYSFVDHTNPIEDSTISKVVSRLSHYLSKVEEIFQEIYRLSATTNPSGNVNSNLHQYLARPLSYSAPHHVRKTNWEKFVSFIVDRLLCGNVAAVHLAQNRCSWNRLSHRLLPDDTQAQVSKEPNTTNTQLHNFPLAMIALLLAHDHVNKHAWVLRLTDAAARILILGRELCKLCESPVPALYHVKQLEGHRDCVTCLLEVPETNQLISGCADKTILVWDLDSGKRSTQGVLVGHCAAVVSMCIMHLELSKHPLTNSPISNHGIHNTDSGEMILISGGEDGTILVWSLLTGQKVWDIEIAHNRTVQGLVSDDEVKLLYSAGHDGFIKIWDMNRIAVHCCCASTHCSPKLEDIKNFNVVEGRKSINTKSVFAHDQGVATILLLINKNQLLSTGVDGHLKLWDLDSFQCIQLIVPKDVTNGFINIKLDDNKSQILQSSPLIPLDTQEVSLGPVIDRNNDVISDSHIVATTNQLPRIWILKHIENHLYVKHCNQIQNGISEKFSASKITVLPPPLQPLELLSQFVRRKPNHSLLRPQQLNSTVKQSVLLVGNGLGSVIPDLIRVVNLEGHSLPKRVKHDESLTEAEQITSTALIRSQRSNQVILGCSNNNILVFGYSYGIFSN